MKMCKCSKHKKCVVASYIRKCVCEKKFCDNVHSPQNAIRKLTASFLNKSENCHAVRDIEPNSCKQ